MSWNACSPDIIVVISYRNETEKPYPLATYNAVSSHGKLYPVACVEIESPVARKALDPHIIIVEGYIYVLFLCESDVMT